MNAIGVNGFRSSLPLPTCLETGKLDCEMLEILLDVIPQSCEKTYMVTGSGTLPHDDTLFSFGQGGFQREIAKSIKLPRPYVTSACQDRFLLLELDDCSIYKVK